MCEFNTANLPGSGRQKRSTGKYIYNKYSKILTLFCFCSQVKSGIQTNLFSPGASWTKRLGAQLKIKGPRIRQKIKLILTPLPSICFSVTLKVCIPQTIYHFNSFWNQPTASVRFDSTTFFQGQAGPLNI